MNLASDPFAFLLTFLIRFLFLIPAITMHEAAHGYVAYWLGDPTAKDRGRLSLNPLRHIDPFGTILLPLILTAMFTVGFGYAKPVPVDPRRFADYRRGMLLTGLAGPAMNFGLAAVSGLAFRALVASGVLVGVAGELAAGVLVTFVLVNLVLLFFNLLPIPPLDGSRVLPIFLSDRALRKYHQFERYGLLVVLLVVWVLPAVVPGLDPVGAYFGATVFPLLRLLAGDTALRVTLLLG